MVNIVVTRKEASDIANSPGWALVFGRRKVGKTFMVQKFVPHDVYFYVRQDRLVKARGTDISEISDTRSFAGLVKGLLLSGKTVIIDEFQRLPLTVYEEIASAHPEGRLVLTGSSMRVAHEIFGGNSPLLGLLQPFNVGQIRASDMLASGAFSAEEAVWNAPVLRDPWTIPFYNSENFLERLCETVRYVVPGLVGEIFTEDERVLTRTYSSILSLVGAGYEDYRDIAGVLFSRGIVKTNGSSSVVPYMTNMVSMGLLDETRRFDNGRKVYRIPSFPMKLHYYLDSRYGTAERPVAFSEVRQAAEDLLRRGVEELVADLFSETLGGRKELLKRKDAELDVLVTVRNKPALVAEVKWGRATKADVGVFLTKVSDFKCRKIFVSKTRLDTDEVEVMTPSDLVKLAETVRR